MSWTCFRGLVGGHLVLTRLVIGDIFDDKYIPDNFESTIVLPSLKSLRICIDHNRYPCTDQILLAISASALEFLSLDQVIEQDLVDIYDHPQLSNPDRFLSIQYLSISIFPGQAVRRPSWTLFCSIFPDITHFTMQLAANEIYTLKPFMVALGLSITAATDSLPIPPILPKLHVLSFDHKT
jgi:hypothetical protein